jgi:soluble lytic murein transglycosylase-like protein
MQRNWIHPEYKLSKWATPAQTPSLDAELPVRSEAISKFLAASTIGLFLAVFLFIYPINQASMPEVMDAALSAFHGFSHTAPADKDQFISKLSVTKKKQFASQVHYVLEIIRSTKKDPAEAMKLALSIVKASYKANYDPLLVASVIKSESTFNRHAISYAGAHGLMQILPDTARYISSRNRFTWQVGKLSDPEYNIQLGIAYLKELEKKFNGNREHALIAYNWGPANLNQAFKGVKKIPGCSIQYAQKILSTHTKWKQEFKARGSEFQYLGVDFRA